MDASFVRLGSLVAVAWLSALGCGGYSAFHLRRLQARRSPGVSALVRRAEEEARDGGGTALMLSELTETLADAERRFGLSTLVPRSLARVSLASGTSLALLVLTGRALSHGAPAVAFALAAFLGGAFGAGLCAAFGRAAREEARSSREAWRKDVREAKRLVGGRAPG